VGFRGGGWRTKSVAGGGEAGGTKFKKISKEKEQRGGLGVMGKKVGS